MSSVTLRCFSRFPNSFYCKSANCQTNQFALSSLSRSFVVQRRVLEFPLSNLKNSFNSSGFCAVRFYLNVPEKNTCKNKMAPTLAPTIKLNNGYDMPVLGLGTYELKKSKCYLAVRHAIDVGYRHIDTAFLYKNEALVGKALSDKIQEGVVKREDIFLVTKLWNIYHEPERVSYACRKQLELLGVDYIDLYLMHSPVGYKYVNDEALMPYEQEVLQLNDIDYVNTYKAMEELVTTGLVRSIGLSNFNSQQIERILSYCSIKPATNQIECHPGLNQKKLIKFCNERDIVVTAYSPLARPKPSKPTPAFYLSDKTQAIARKYEKTVAQVILRYLLDIGTVPIPKSSHFERLVENISIFDFQLTSDEIAVLDGFNTGDRLWKFQVAQHHKYWPYNIEY